MYISSGRVCRPFQTLSPETPQIKLFNRVPRTNYKSKEAQGRKSNAARDWKAAESVITVMFWVSALPQNNTPEVGLLSEVEKNRKEQKERTPETLLQLITFRIEKLINWGETGGFLHALCLLSFKAKYAPSVLKWIIIQSYL